MLSGVQVPSSGYDTLVSGTEIFRYRRCGPHEALAASARRRHHRLTMLPCPAAMASKCASHALLGLEDASTAASCQCLLINLNTSNMPCRHQLPDGTHLEEHFMDWFSMHHGYDCYALSLRAQGGSDRAPGVKTAGTLQSHAEDLQHFIASLPARPVVLAHSFGGLIIQRYLLRGTQAAHRGALPDAASRMAGLALLAACPPTGNSGIVTRLFRRAPWQAVRLTWGFVTKSFLRSASACQDLFFSPAMPAEEAQRLQECLKRWASPVSLLDVGELAKGEVPLPPAQGAAPLPPLMVLGAAADKVVDVQGVQRTAEWYGVPPQVLDGMAHNVMLDTTWEEAAEAILHWLEHEVRPRLQQTAQQSTLRQEGSA